MRSPGHTWVIHPSRNVVYDGSRLIRIGHPRQQPAGRTSGSSAPVSAARAVGGPETQQSNEGRVSCDRFPRTAAVELEVTDSGRGIAPEILPHVFDPFRQGDRDQIRRKRWLGPWTRHRETSRRAARRFRDSAERRTGPRRHVQSKAAVGPTALTPGKPFLSRSRLRTRRRCPRALNSVWPGPRRQLFFEVFAKTLVYTRSIWVLPHEGHFTFPSVSVIERLTSKFLSHLWHLYS